MDQHVKSTRPGLPYTGKPHARVLLVESSTDMSHGSVPVEPKFSPIQKKANLEGFLGILKPI
ncbi:hypothetical protein F383_02214 [Gossypium arboreum]|uniref:Uncharacterized protein n=1 Tax=Gossypium arboreum TaxID=29729 RepID=A0A0B0PNA5_GOSAR|nr:hypothetical protein F383_02214 [Gossypium arboreum]